MLNHPVIRVLFLALGVFFIFRFAMQVWPPLVVIITVAAGLWALSLWVLRWERDLAARLCHDMPAVSPVLAFVARTAKLAVPIAGSASDALGPNPDGSRRTTTAGDTLLIKSVHELQEARQQVKGDVIGYNDVVDTVLRSVYASFKSRERAATDIQHAPLGSFLFVGKEGLGKHYVAKRLAAAIYDGGAYLSVDLEEFVQNQDVARTAVIEAVATNPQLTIIIENIDKANKVFVTWLANLYKEKTALHPQSGAPVGFEYTVFFLLVAKDGTSLQAMEQGSTMLAQQISALTGLATELVWFLSHTAAFVLPDQEARMEIVAHAMIQEAAKYGLNLRSVSPELVAREVIAVEKTGNFSALAGRIEKRLAPAIRNALAAGVIELVVDDESAQPPMRHVNHPITGGYSGHAAAPD